MILKRVWREDIQSHGLVTPDAKYALRTHAESEDCYQHGCAIHFPTATATANVEKWPYNWREDRGLLERICPHGIGHPDPDAANFNIRKGRESENVHACDGCCA